MDYKELLEQLTCEDNCDVLDYIDDAVTAITELLERAKKAEQERDAAIADIKRIVCDLYEDDVLCKEFCKNHDGVCSSKAELGLYEDCRGFEWRGVQEN